MALKIEGMLEYIHVQLNDEGIEPQRSERKLIPVDELKVRRAGIQYYQGIYPEDELTDIELARVIQYTPHPGPKSIIFLISEQLRTIKGAFRDRFIPPDVSEYQG